MQVSQPRPHQRCAGVANFRHHVVHRRIVPFASIPLTRTDDKVLALGNMRPAQQKAIALDQTWSQPQPTIASHANPTVSASARLNNNRTAQEEIIMQKQTSRLAGRA